MRGKDTARPGSIPSEGMPAWKPKAELFRNDKLKERLKDFKAKMPLTKMMHLS